MNGGLVSRIRSFTVDAKALILMSTIGALAGSLFGIYGMAFSIYLVELGYSSEQIGWVVAMSGVTSIFGFFVSGIIADRYGRRRVLVASIVMSTASVALFLLPPNYWLFLSASGLLGLAGSFSGPAFGALMAEKSGEEDRKYLFSYQSFLGTLGGGVGFIFAGVIPDSLTTFFGVGTLDGIRVVIAIATLICFTQIGALLFVRDESEFSSKFSFEGGSWSMISKFALTSAVIGFGAGLLIPWFPVIFREGWDMELTTVGLIMTVAQFAMSFTYLLVPDIADRFGSVSTVAITEFLAIVALFAMPLSGSMEFFVALYILRMAFMLMGGPISSAFMMSKVKPEERATASAVSALGWNVAWSVSQGLSGYIWQDDYTRTLPFYLCGAFYTIHLLLFLFFFARMEDKDPDASLTGRIDAFIHRIFAKRV